MKEWNAVISVHEHGYRKAWDVFSDFGEVHRTEFYNILLLHTEQMESMLRALRERYERDSESLAFLARLVPVMKAFIFHSAEEFEAKSREVVLGWTQALAGKGFHVRIRRRGFKGRIKSPDEERFLDGVILDDLEKKGQHGRIDFDHPEAIVAVETVGTWAGFFLWTPKEFEDYSFVRV